MAMKAKAEASPAEAPETAAPAAAPAVRALTTEVTGQALPAPAKTRINMSEGMEKAMKTAEEFVAFGQGNLEALVKSGQIWFTGLQDISKQFAATAQAQLEETMSAFKAITGAKSVKDAFDLQAGFARAAIEKTIAESGKFTESSVKLTEQAMAPITARFALAVEKFARPAA
ncbi:MAG TPA: phasin family protein [Acetobacteraceae bacterium]|nr:phasin family protein [Acetobacteraceae bacterium]